MSRRLTLQLGCVILAMLAAPVFSSAQGVQTGVLSGSVSDPDGLPLPGATVTVTSPALQGERTVVTDAIGAYIVRGLPPGTYTVRFQFPGTADVEETTVVPLGGVADVDATLRLAGLQETVQVTAEARPPALAVTQTATNLTAEVVNVLPTGRRPFEIAQLAPGVTDNTPNVGQVAVGGAFAFDSLFLVDGVDTNDNLFGSSHGLFIEDAIAETQVITSGASAEFGRFAGGVVNVITKSGGNEFSGSFRTNFSKPSWTQETPFQRSRNQQNAERLSKFFEGTIGGPVVRDRLWFFNANRYENSQTARALALQGTSYSEGNNNKRLEVKLTGTPVVSHMVSGTFLNNPTKQANRPAINADFSSDSATLVNRELPNRLWVLNWNGALTNQAFATFQFSNKTFGFRGAGGTSAQMIDSPYLSRGVVAGTEANRHFNAPYFSANDPEDRNNRQYAGSVSYYVTSPSVGRHDLKVGGEHFTSSRNGGNSQSATGFVIRTDYLLAGGRPVTDSAGRLIPVFSGNAANPAGAATRIENWISVPGAELQIRTLSLYVQDRWTITDRLTADLGLRFEDVKSEATGDIVGADTRTWLPRVGVSYDVTGGGGLVAQATYGRYSGRFSERAFGRNTNVGTPSLVNYAYIGPSGQGRDFAPALDLRNYAVIGGNFPTANVFFDPDLSSAKTDEVTLSLGRELGGGGHVKATYIWRETGGVIEDFIDDPSLAGKTTVIRNGVNFGTFDNVTWRNADGPDRDYQALQFDSRIAAIARLPIFANYTLQIKNHGNFEGEAANQPGNGSIWFDYPEMFYERYFPYGRLDEFQRHKLRVWTTYTQRLGAFGNVDVSPLWRVNSGQTESLFATGVPMSPIQIARNPGYARANTTTASLFFGDRGIEEFKGYGVLDLAVRYGVPVWQTVQPWLQVQIYNVLNNQKQIKWNTSVTRDLSSPLDAMGQPTGFTRGATFGQATANTHFPGWSTGETGGRTFRLALGVRF
ncbi:MAG: TonB-dependent receptor [Acidimicrobiia bacterium]|nr:TonB-dependent receptor [Acidimicrobiia bacterium]